MKRKRLHEQLIDYIPSKTLKAVIQKKNHRFSESEMLALACKISPTDSICCSLLQDMLNEFNDRNVTRAIHRMLQLEKDKLAVFIESFDNCFYDVIIKDALNTYESRQAFVSFSDAIEYINKVDISYFNENNEAELIIEKRTITTNLDYDDEYDGTQGYCKYNGNRDLVSVEISSIKECSQDFDEGCIDCTDICLNNIEIKYPRFLNNFDIVSFKRNAKTEYGVFFLFDSDDDFTDVAYLHPLKSEYIYKKDYENLHNDHMHIDYFSIEKVELDELEPWLQKNYHDYKAYFNESTEDN